MSFFLLGKKAFASVLGQMMNYFFLTSHWWKMAVNDIFPTSLGFRGCHIKRCIVFSDYFVVTGACFILILKFFFVGWTCSALFMFMTHNMYIKQKSELQNMMIISKKWMLNDLWIRYTHTKKGFDFFSLYNVAIKFTKTTINCFFFPSHFLFVYLEKFNAAKIKEVMSNFN